MQQADQFGITGTPLFPSAGAIVQQDEETEEVEGGGEGEVGEEEMQEEGGGGGEGGEGEGEREEEGDVEGEVEIESKPNVGEPEERAGPSGQTEE